MPTYVLLIWALSILLLLVFYSDHPDDDSNGPGGGTLIPIKNLTS